MSLIGQSRYVGEPVAAVFAAIPVGVMRSIGVSLMSTSLPTRWRPATACPEWPSVAVEYEPPKYVFRVN
jgi:hypothetical protein